MKLTPTQRALLHVHITGCIPGRIREQTYRAVIDHIEIAESIKISVFSYRDVWRLTAKGRELMAKVPAVIAADWLLQTQYGLKPYQTSHAETHYYYKHENGAEATLNAITGGITVYEKGRGTPSTGYIGPKYLFEWAAQRAVEL